MLEFSFSYPIKCKWLADLLVEEEWPIWYTQMYDWSFSSSSNWKNVMSRRVLPVKLITGATALNLMGALVIMCIIIPGAAWLLITKEAPFLCCSTSIAFQL